MTQKNKNIPQTLCEFHSFLARTGDRNPKCSAEYPGSGFNYSTTHIHKGLPSLVPLETISRYLQVMKLFGKEAFKGLTCLGHETTESRV